MARTLGTMLTWTTYGMWMRGDLRQWVEKAKVWPRDPVLEARDRGRLRYPPFLLPQEQRLTAGDLIGEVVAGLKAKVHALTVGSWHVHVVISYVNTPLCEVIKLLKERVRMGLSYRRAIWGGGYDKRFCFDRQSLQARIDYVREHNVEDGLPPDPWDFIVRPS
ncbi:MAG TPA: hypothetical protein VMZ50_12585 [Phycisphaerae bacterium]|nr:hypothetical protein [Phycisphaerae bacterium]